MSDSPGDDPHKRRVSIVGEGKQWPRVARMTRAHRRWIETPRIATIVSNQSRAVRPKRARARLPNGDLPAGGVPGTTGPLHDERRPSSRTDAFLVLSELSRDVVQPLAEKARPV